MAFNKQQNGGKKSNFEKIGALWRKQSQNDPSVNYLAGNIEIDGQKIQITVMKNNFKNAPGSNPNAPDYVISSPVDGPQQQQGGGGQNFGKKPAPQQRQQAAKPTFRKPAPTRQQPAEDFDSEASQEPDNASEADF